MIAPLLKRIADKLYDWHDTLTPSSFVEKLEPVIDERDAAIYDEVEYDDQQKLEDIEKDDPFSYSQLIDYQKYKPKHFGKHEKVAPNAPKQMITDKPQRRGSSYGGDKKLW